MKLLRNQLRIDEKKKTRPKTGHQNIKFSSLRILKWKITLAPGVEN